MQSSRYDQWLTTQLEAPDILVPGDESYPRCSGCGAFLKRDEFEADSGEQTLPCDGEVNPEYGQSSCGRSQDHEPHDPVVWAWGIERRTCRKCGAVSERVTG
jgi:hypothetical protein